MGPTDEHVLSLGCGVVLLHDLTNDLALRRRGGGRVSKEESTTVETYLDLTHWTLNHK
jgi:hypothetical protein